MNHIQCLIIRFAQSLIAVHIHILVSVRYHNISVAVIFCAVITHDHLDPALLFYALICDRVTYIFIINNYNSKYLCHLRTPIPISYNTESWTSAILKYHADFLNFPDAIYDKHTPTERKRFCNADAPFSKDPHPPYT